MARRKSPAEVGPLGVWAYDTRDALDLSVEAAVAALPTQYHPATLRKVEGGSARPGTRMWRELGNLYARIATEKGVAIDPQPRLTPEPLEATQGGDSAAVVAAVAAAIDRQTQAIVEAIRSRDNILENLLSELGRYRSAQLDVLRALQETGPRAEPMPEDEPELDPPDPAPMRPGRQ